VLRYALRVKKYKYIQKFLYVNVKGGSLLYINGKVVPVLNYALRYEDVLGEWMYSSTHS
jgi:hypothetical protein